LRDPRLELAADPLEVYLTWVDVRVLSGLRSADRRPRRQIAEMIKRAPIRIKPPDSDMEAKRVMAYLTRKIKAGRSPKGVFR
jgi:hypothetical protein